ncbi:hypothetical protein CFC21_042174 [Triticum aestivum]|uniref:Jekyll 3 n=4 Tax=Triticum TaxID=4564 RepID=A0A9R1QLQ2_TRITD|nr:uncharacterized protein LOC119281517 [Triticum dicoccoides]XP_044344845.1 uncharacterized protein LOC123065669 [Triticum aestivum]QCX08911.1 jekyll 1B [Triticum turgidum subsp. dicoccum]VAH79669.1 unnamed protein product [Triticum turgidum subsp. durum]KAF7030690.1 hypothetical protein CFC21_042174 [Triticum aestivum]CDJ26291.1 unnamed protein product [Triticum aestivum]
MAARAGKALALAMLISFLVVQGTTGKLTENCYCVFYNWCFNFGPKPRDHVICMEKSLKHCFKGCPRTATTPYVTPLADLVNPVTDEGSMAVPAGGADHGEFHVTEGSVAAPAGGADHGKFNVAEEDAAP